MKSRLWGVVSVPVLAVAACGGPASEDTGVGRAALTGSDGGSVLSAPLAASDDGGSEAAASSACVTSGSPMVYVWGDNENGEIGDCAWTPPVADGGSVPLSSVTIAQPTAVRFGTPIASVAAGGDHSLALDENGTVWAWGANDAGQVGVAPSHYVACPKPVLMGVKSIAAGLFYSVALKQDGTLWTWGDNLYGELGRAGAGASATFDAQPREVDGLGANITSVSAGRYHVLAQRVDGQVWGWGKNYQGQLGRHAGGTYPSTNNTVAPTRIVEIPTTTTALLAGAYTSYYLVGGKVWAIGDNTYGNLGVRLNAHRPIGVPVEVPGISDIRQVAASFHALALGYDGQVHSWGHNASGQLGFPAGADSDTARLVPGTPAAVTSIATGDYTSFAIDDTSLLWAWGDDGTYELGTQAFASTSTPTLVSALAGVQQISSGGEHSIALALCGPAPGSSNGCPATAPSLCGGTCTDPLTDVNNCGACGQVCAGACKAGQCIPATAIAAGDAFACALLADQTVDCWGANVYGELGNGTVGGSSSRPTPVPNLTNVIGIATNFVGNYICAWLSGGTVECWGMPAATGSTNQIFPTPTPVPNLTGVRQVATADDHSCALLSDGTVACWGANNLGQLGNGTNIDSATPVPVTNVSGATAVTVSIGDSCALLASGALTCWGNDRNGQLGDGNQTNYESTPVASEVSGAIAVSLSQEFGCALLSTGAVACWGDNSCDELGNGTTVNSLTPVTVANTATATAISVGQCGAFELLSGGAVAGWGTTSPVPMIQPGLTGGATAISTGTSYCAIVGGTVECWGVNNYGQLGNGTMTSSATPVPVAW